MTTDTVQNTLIRVPFGPITWNISKLVNASSAIGNDLWFYSPKWQALEAEADADIDQGRFTSHENMDDFITALDS